eukprot:881905-Rhodomonas_salina.2
MLRSERARDHGCTDASLSLPSRSSPLPFHLMCSFLFPCPLLAARRHFREDDEALLCQQPLPLSGCVTSLPPSCAPAPRSYSLPLPPSGVKAIAEALMPETPKILYRYPPTRSLRILRY